MPRSLSDPFPSTRRTYVSRSNSSVQLVTRGALGFFQIRFGLDGLVVMRERHAVAALRLVHFSEIVKALRGIVVLDLRDVFEHDLELALLGADDDAVRVLFDDEAFHFIAVLV